MTIFWTKGDPANAAANQQKANDTIRAFNLVNHPEVDTSDDTPVQWEGTVGAQIAAENTAERNGVSLGAAQNAIRQGCDGRGEQVTPRSGEVYLDRGTPGKD